MRPPPPLSDDDPDPLGPGAHSAPPAPRPRSEAELIALVDAALRRYGMPADLTDDCAHLTGETRLVTTDSLVEFRHFDLERDTPREVGRQAAVVNLSDLAASGGAPGWLVWSLDLPDRWGLDLVAGVIDGFIAACAAEGAQVVGGNLSSIDGPAVISVTAAGPLAGDRPFLRRGARPGDALYVTGPLGDGALGYLEPDAEARRHRHRWRPHLAEARTLAEWGHVRAAMDVSDGLAIDLGRLCRTSGVAARLESAAIPTSLHYKQRRGDDLDAALTGGEDYVLLFAAPADVPPPPAANAARIGRLVARDDGPVLTLDGAPLAARGHDHFAGGAA